MKFSALAPARRTVPNTGRYCTVPGNGMSQFFDERRVELYASGTAALARAIADCAARSGAATPEVIIPAYGCPDLVAACLHASVYPRLVDLQSGSWGYDPRLLRSAVSPNTAAIVTVDLLAVGDDATALAEFTRERGIRLIQDSAQHLPRLRHTWPGDYVILSFGRGKPLNLLHGGVLVGPPNSRILTAPADARTPWRDRLLDTHPARVAFNFLTHRRVYWAVSRLPGTGLGRVSYKKLLNAAPLPETAWARVNASFGKYCAQSSYSIAPWSDSLHKWKSFGIEKLTCPTGPPDAEPLRLALLAPTRVVRDGLLSQLQRQGLGASRMYGCPLSEITGIPDVVRRQGPFPNAARLSDRLFTLPTHLQVTTEIVRLADAVVSSYFDTHPPS